MSEQTPTVQERLVAFIQARELLIGNDAETVAEFNGEKLTMTDLRALTTFAQPTITDALVTEVWKALPDQCNVEMEQVRYALTYAFGRPDPVPAPPL